MGERLQKFMASAGVASRRASEKLIEEGRVTVNGIVATLGVVSPSLIIITLIAMLLENFMDILWVQHAFAGIRVAVCALIGSSVIKLAKSNLKKWWHAALAVGAFIVVMFGLSPVYVVVACAVLSFIFGKKVQKA